MGCGCQKVSTESIRSTTKEESSPSTLTSSTALTKSTENPPVPKPCYLRTSRNGDTLDYFDRDPIRPIRNREMQRDYQNVSDALSSEVDEELPYRTKLPSVGLQLEYVYGYKCFVGAQNLFYTANPEVVVYPSGAMVVLLDKASNSQRFLGAGDLKEVNGHSDDILALALSQDRDYIATGEVGSNPLICVWKMGGWMHPVKSFEQGAESRGVGLLAFSNDAKLLLAVDIARQQTIRVYDWKSETELLCSESVSTGYVISCAWSLKALCFCTVSPVYFWSKTGSHSFHCVAGGGDWVGVHMRVVAWLSTGNCITGGQGGKLYLWSEHKVIKTAQVLATDANIEALIVVRDFIVTGGSDNIVRVLDAAFKEISEVAVLSSPRSLDYSQKTVLCGTVDGTIQELKEHSRSILMESHSEGEVWGAALDPKDRKMLITTGDDNKIRCWDLSQRRCIMTGILETALFPTLSPSNSLPLRSQQSRALCISPNGHVAVGHNDGHVTIRQSRLQLNNILAVLTNAKDCVLIMRYSPTATFLAIGSVDCGVYVYDVSSGYTLFFSLTGHTGPVVSLDWGLHEDLLKTCSYEGELLYWELQSESKLSPTDSKVLDEKWVTWTSATGWPVAGINQVTEIPEFITNVTRSHDLKYVAVGNSWGLLELYRYPNGPGSQGRVYRAHSLEVTTILWTEQDRGLVTLGGPDLSILQWRIASNPLPFSS